MRYRPVREYGDRGHVAPQASVPIAPFVWFYRLHPIPRTKLTCQDSYFCAPICAVDIVVPVKIGLGQHIFWRPLPMILAIFPTILFQCLSDIFKGQLTNAESNWNPDGGLCMVTDFHCPTANIAHVANACAATH